MELGLQVKSDELHFTTVSSGDSAPFYMHYNYWAVQLLSSS